MSRRHNGINELKFIALLGYFANRKRVVVDISKNKGNLRVENNISNGDSVIHLIS